MNGDGKFMHGRYTTIPETKNTKLPIGGHIRLGVRVKNEQGIEYPKETTYFVCPEEVRDKFGDEPTELIVFFPRANREEVFPQAYEKYGSNNALLCKGDGEVSKTAQRLNLENGRWEDVKCPCEHYNKKYDPKTKIGGCSKVGHLFFMIPSVSIGTFFECTIHGTVSISEVNSGFNVAEITTGGCWAMIPFRMRRVAKKLKIPGTAKMKTHWVVTLTVAASAEEIKSVKRGEVLYLGQNVHYELEAPGLPKENKAYVPQETEEETKAREAEAAKKKKALLKEYEESKARTAQLEKEIEAGKHDIKPLQEAKVISQEEKEEETVVEPATQEQIAKIKKEILESPLLTEEEYFKLGDLIKKGMNKTEADKAITWWSKVEPIRKIEKENQAKLANVTKEERIKVAQEIVSRPGKLEVKDEGALFPGEEITKEDIPGSSPANAIPFKGKAKK